MESLAEIFYEEASEMLQQMEQILLRMETEGADSESINELFRFAHSLKGSSGVMGFTHINRFTHGLENALDSVRKGTKPFTSALTSVLLRCIDVINRMLDASKVSGDTDDPNCEKLLDEVKQTLNAENIPTVPAAPQEHINSPVEKAAEVFNNKETTYRILFTPGSQIGAENDPISILQELSEYGVILKSHLEENIPPLEEYDPKTCYVRWHLDFRTQANPVIIRSILELSGEGGEATIEPLEENEKPDQTPLSTCEKASADQPPASSDTQEGSVSQSVRKISESATIRVATSKIDALFDLTSEIVIAQSMLTTTQSRIQDSEARGVIAQMERYVRDLHEHVMAIRMIPVGYVFNRFPRMVRELAMTTGKKVQLEISGEETELDRTLLEALTDPITHLLRNSIDHGIETPEERLKVGKPETGTVHLNAFQAEGRIHVEISDDGKGIDVEGVRQKAVQLGWISPEDHPSTEEIYEFLFRPGFSTAKKVTDISGRGVGMDVVRKNVEQLGGMTMVQSEPGKGSRFLIKVPLTLAIMDGLNLRVGGEHFIVPLTSVIETFQPENVNLCSALGGCEMVNIRGRFLPLIRLSDALKMRLERASIEDGLVVILEQDTEQVAIHVDEIVGQHQVVMKSLETNFVRVPGFSGACILGDGHVALIVDVGELIRRTQDHALANLQLETV